MHLGLRTFAATASLLLESVVTAPAHADEATLNYITNAFEKSSAGESPENDPLSNLARFTTQSESGAYMARFSSKASLEIPSKPTDRIKFTSRNGTSISVGLPFASYAKTAEQIAEGAVAFDNQNESTSSVMAKSDGSLQIATVLKSPKAPMPQQLIHTNSPFRSGQQPFQSKTEAWHSFSAMESILAA